MKYFHLHYVQEEKDKTETSLYWRCQAEDIDHAVEQLTDSIRFLDARLIFWEIMT